MAQAIMLFGPTASGKTGLAIGLAQHLNGVVINADSRQVYQGMPLLTASPSAEEYAAAPHRLYEFLPPDSTYSAGDYLKQASQTAAEVIANGQTPVFVGGTGLYLDVLLHGLSPVPEIPAEVLQQLKNELATHGLTPLQAELQRVDPHWAAQIPPTDTQRLLRGLSVYRHTGKPFTYWQQQPRAGALPYAVTCLAIQRPRAETHARLEQRFHQIQAPGILAEVADLLKKGYTEDLPALKSLGFKEFSAHLKDQTTFKDAQNAYLASQRKYVKRQETWLKNTYPAHRIYQNPTVQTLIADL